MKREQTVALAFLVIRCTRGSDGVHFVGSYIRGHFVEFQRDFHSFCTGLVAACRTACSSQGDQYLSHREGLHAGLSGMHFVETLKYSGVRRALLEVSKEWGRLLVGTIGDGMGRKSLVSKDIIQMGESLGHVVLAKHNDYRHMGPYNRMDTMRCFMVVHEQVLGSQATVYCEKLHEWYRKQQSKKRREAIAQMLTEYGAVDRKGMEREVAEMQEELGLEYTVTCSTMFVLRCETRQVVNEYGLGGALEALCILCGRKHVRDSRS